MLMRLFLRASSPVSGFSSLSIAFLMDGGGDCALLCVVNEIMVNSTEASIVFILENDEFSRINEFLVY